MTAKQPTEKIVLLTHADYLPTLEAARDLGRNGIKVVVADSKRHRVSCWSKYVTYVKSPEITDTENFIKWLKEKAKEGLFTTVLPTSDVMVWYLSSREKEFRGLFDTFIPSRRSVEATLFKNEMDSFCHKFRISTPKTYFPKSYNEVKRLAWKLRYPILIKHNTNVGIKSEKKGDLVNSPEELLKAYRKDKVVYDRRVILKRFPYVEWPMLQEYIPNALENIHNTMGLSMEGGKFISLQCTKKVRQEPPKLGVGICVKPIKNDGAVKEVSKFIKAAKYSGHFGIETIYDERDGKEKIIDFNPRVTGPLRVATGNGLHLPMLWFEALYKNKKVKNQVFVGNRVFIHLISDILYLPGNIFHSVNKSRALKSIASSYFGPKEFAVLSLRDPMPALIDVVITVRNKIKHPLFYLRELYKGE